MCLCLSPLRSSSRAFNQDVPPKSMLKPSEERCWHRAEVGLEDVPVLHVILNLVGKDVVHGDACDREPRRLEQPFCPEAAIRIGDRTPGLCLGMPCDELVESPHTAPPRAKQDSKHLRRPPVVHHDL